MKDGSYFRVNVWRDDIERAMILVWKGDSMPFHTYDRLDAGIPLPQIIVDVREIASVEDDRG